MLEIFDKYGIVDIRHGDQNAQVYLNKDTNKWELFLSDGNMMNPFDNKQEAIDEGTKWVTRR